MDSLQEKLALYAKNNLNVMFIGSHGVGKSTVALQVIKDSGLKCKYYSASTLDPWADLVGIPVPDKKSGTLEFCRPTDLLDAEALVFDELNRAHPRVLNAVLEIVQFKSINGTKLPNLKFVWACINPPGGEYQVEELDPALVDRFHIFIKMPATINVEYLATKMDKKIAKTLQDWWISDLDAEQKRNFTPRRVEYVGTLISKGIPWKDSIPQGHTFPIGTLEDKLNSLVSTKKSFSFDKDYILKNPKDVLSYYKENPQICNKLADVISTLEGEEIYQVRDIFENLPKELCNKIGAYRFDCVKRSIMEKFISDKIEYKKKYPKFTEAFSFETLSEK